MKELNNYILEKLHLGKNTSIKYFIDLHTGSQIYKYIDKKYKHHPKVYYWFILNETDFINIYNEFNFYSKDKFNKAFKTVYKIDNCNEAVLKMQSISVSFEFDEIVDKYPDNIHEVEDPYEFINKNYKSSLKDKKDIIGNTKVNVNDKDVPKEFADTEYPESKSIKDKNNNDRMWFKFWKVLAYNGPMSKMDLMRKVNPEANEGSNTSMFASLVNQNIIKYDKKSKMLEAQPVSTWKI